MIKLNVARKLHLYMGLIFAPSIILFAFTGLFQIYSLHYNHDKFVAAPWLVFLGQVHMHQRTAPEGAATHAPLQWFFSLLAIGLIVTTLLGIYMSFAYTKRRRIIFALLAVGVALPSALLYL